MHHQQFHKWNGAILLIIKLNYWESLNRSIYSGKQKAQEPQGGGWTTRIVSSFEWNQFFVPFHERFVSVTALELFFPFFGTQSLCIMPNSEFTFQNFIFLMVFLYRPYRLDCCFFQRLLFFDLILPIFVSSCQSVFFQTNFS